MLPTVKIITATKMAENAGQHADADNLNLRPIGNTIEVELIYN